MTSKRYKKLPEKTKELKAENIDKLIALVKKNCTSKFDESIDLSFQINNKQKKNEINLRTVVNLPGGSGKKIKVAAVCEESKVKSDIDNNIALLVAIKSNLTTANSTLFKVSKDFDNVKLLPSSLELESLI